MTFNSYSNANIPVLVEYFHESEDGVGVLIDDKNTISEVTGMLDYFGTIVELRQIWDTWGRNHNSIPGWTGNWPWLSPSNLEPSPEQRVKPTPQN